MTSNGPNKERRIILGWQASVFLASVTLLLLVFADTVQAPPPGGIPGKLPELIERVEALEDQVAFLSENAILEIYSAPQVLADILPGEFGGVRSFCDLGDTVVSGAIVIRSRTGSLTDFRIISSEIVIDGMTGQESWLLQGINAAADTADIRVVAICAR